MKKQKKQPCPGCNGTGQMTWFGGASRFQFSYEDCPECNGFGFLEPETSESAITASQIADNSPLSLEQAEKFLQALSQILSSTLAQGEDIRLKKFGRFSCPAGNTAKKTIRFKTSNNLLKFLNKDN